MISEETTSITNFSNEDLIENYLSYYDHSIQSVKMRKTSLKTFFHKDNYGFDKHIKELTTIELKHYFSWLKKQPVTLNTKTNKWRILKSFIESVKEDFPDFYLVFPRRNLNWGNQHKKPWKKEYLTKEELKKLLDYFKTTNYKRYLIFRVLAETGMRKGGITYIKLNSIDFDKRTIEVIEKNNQSLPNVYYFSKNLGIHLKMYVDQIKQMNEKVEYLFFSKFMGEYKPYSSRRFNTILDETCEKIGIEKNITCHTFRRSLNNFRDRMGCDLMNRKILLNHKINDVNYQSYTRKDYDKFIKLYDKYYPFYDLNL